MQKYNDKDVFITPCELAKRQIDMIDIVQGDAWYDPFRGTGVFFNQFPNTGKEHKWSEITDGRDFFEQEIKADVICSNPPYTKLNDILRRIIILSPRVVSLLIGVGNLTARRLEWMRDGGYNVTKLHMCKIWTCYGMSFIVQFEKNKPALLTFDRIVWKDQNENNKYWDENHRDKIQKK